MRSRSFVIGAIAATLMAAGAASFAKAATVTDIITFTDQGTYGVNGAAWKGSAVASGTIKITFDPSKVYLDQSIKNVASLSFSVNDPRFSSASFNTNNLYFTYAYGTLDIFNGPVNQYGGPSKDLKGLSDFVIGINGWSNAHPASAVWYSQSGFGDTITTSGKVSISAVPVPAALPMFFASLLGLGAVARQRRKHKTV